LVHKGIISTVTRVDMWHITLRGLWCDIIVQNVDASAEDKGDI